jgi:hypothetical protein
MWELIAKLVDADKLGGWVRAAVAVLLGSAATWFGGKLAPFLTTELQATIGLIVATVVVGVWSQIAKKYSQQAPQQDEGSDDAPRRKGR